MARILEPSSDAIEAAVAQIHSGGLVVMPTETVYGLAANANDDAACRKIFEVKGRPLTDPLICHVAAIDDVAILWRGAEDPEIIELAVELGRRFWPGPLTIVARASSHVAPTTTGGSGYVGVRIPNHPVAHKFLAAVRVPIAAPSANTFGHVSPTTAKHAFDDLAKRDPSLIILDGGQCSVGIESTVIKFSDRATVEVLRRGKITVCELSRSLAQIEEDSFTIKGVRQPVVKVTVRDTRSRYCSGDASQDSPGQMLCHYSPRLPCYLVDPQQLRSLQSGVHEKLSILVNGDRVALIPGHKSPIVVIDFFSLLEPLRTALSIPSENYITLSRSGDASEARYNVFHVLRESELRVGVRAVLVPFLSEFGELLQDCTNKSTDDSMVTKEILAAVEDKLFRAASGKLVAIELY